MCKKLALFVDSRGDLKHLENSYDTPEGQRILRERMWLDDDVTAVLVIKMFPLDHPTDLVEEEVRRIRDRFDRASLVRMHHLRPTNASWVCARAFC